MCQESVFPVEGLEGRACSFGMRQAECGSWCSAVGRRGPWGAAPPASPRGDRAGRAGAWRTVMSTLAAISTVFVPWQRGDRRQRKHADAALTARSVLSDWPLPRLVEKAGETTWSKASCTSSGTSGLDYRGRSSLPANERCAPRMRTRWTRGRWYPPVACAPAQAQGGRNTALRCSYGRGAPPAHTWRWPGQGAELSPQ